MLNYRSKFCLGSGGGDFVLFARYTGGILSSSTKKGGGDYVRGGFCPDTDVTDCKIYPARMLEGSKLLVY